MTSGFSLRLNNKKSTENILYNKIDNNKYNGRLSLFFNTNKCLNIPKFYSYLEKSSKESIIDTFLLVFYIRDCRGGKGERELGRYGLTWLFLKYPSYFSKIMNFLPKYGRWDDIMEIWPKKLDLNDIDFICDNYCIDKNHIKIDYLKKVQNDSILFVGNQLIKDKKNMLEGNSISLCAKWCPSENCSLDIKYCLAKILCKTMKWSMKEYRKEFLSPLRKYLKIIETFVCNSEWEKIDFDNIPYYCVKKYKKIFKKNIPEKYDFWKNNTTNNNLLLPHQILSNIRNNINTNMYNKHWETIEKNFEDLQNMICVCDVSPSMYKWEDKNIISNFLPVDISISLSLLISKYNNTIFNNHIISFSTNPEFIIIDNQDSLSEKYNKIKNMNWEGNSNIDSILTLILDKLLKHKKIENSPDSLIIISDMKINNLEYENDTINLDKITQTYKLNGYKIPKIIFWNLNSSSNELPIYQINNITIISGFSLIILKNIIFKKNFDASDIMNNLIYNDRYNSIIEQINI
jgi:hypothetical protein